MSRERITQQVVVNVNIAELLSGSIHRMSHVFRYSSVPVIRRENVAEHTFYVAMYAYLIAQDLIQQGYEVDLGVLLSRTLVHDLDESMTGDFLRYVKYGHPDLKKALDEVSMSMIDKMTTSLRTGGSAVKKSWSEAKADDIEGHIVQIVDLARVITYVWEEIQTGNRHVKRILPECCSYIQEFISAFPDSPVTPYAVQIVQWAEAKERECS